jgi:lipid-binding SYLF domain-containing protein
MRSFLLAAVAVTGVLGAIPAAWAQGRQQALVDRATISLEEMLSPESGADWRSVLQRSRGVMICPRIFRIGFLIGGSGGDCVLLARDGAGGWSDPAFFAMGSGSLGFQAGIQDSEFVMMILTRRGLDAVLDSQFKFGADASLTFATLGAGVEGDTTAALRADIVAYSKSSGLFAGIAFNGSILTSDTAWDQAYYGAPLAARQIVLQAQVNNAGANPLRAMLAQFGGTAAPAAAPPPQAYAPSGYAPPQPAYRPPDATPYTPPPSGAITQQSLPPPQR